MPRRASFALFTLSTATLALGQAYIAPSFRAPILESMIERPLRYRPDGSDFVISNGEEFFNRPLYGPNTAFRVDAGDRPEFSLYLPGRGGNLRLAVRRGSQTRWLHAAAEVTARYRPGSMIYAIQDPLLGGRTLHVHALPLADREGLVLQVELKGADTPDDSQLELAWAYGGVTGERGKRDGDLGTEEVPISEYFQLQPAFCSENTFTLDERSFTLDSPVARIRGLLPAGARQAIVDANAWHAASANALFDSGGTGATVAQPVVVGRAPLREGEHLHLGLQRIPRAEDDRTELADYRAVRRERRASTTTLPLADTPLTPTELPAAFTAAEQRRAAVAGTLVVETPDPFLNAAVGALNVAADAVWDEAQGAVVHGAVAWRTKLLGWRGPYVNDAIGRHDRARRHITHWVGNQNTDPIPQQLPPPDADTNLARSEAALHSNGDLSHSHYDMNLVYIDAVFRHLLWTGDRALAEELWPMIERHLAWERRLFRRPFGPDGLPLYEAYAAIWASDDIGYNGGGTTHATAYNHWHNLMAARVARWIGRDPAPYEAEAAAIRRAMERELWLPDRGWFAEYRDGLGLRRAHPSAALWTFYHTVDSAAATPFEAYQMTRYIDTQRAHIPLRGPGVPPGHYTLPTTDWMPYIWSTNNVVVSEVTHTSLGYWQSQRQDEAWRLFKGALLDSMFLGKCPGNAGMCTAFDMARGETQRDFADSAGMAARTLVEGLFGLQPDAIAGELLVRPGLPAEWTHARLEHARVGFAYQRDNDNEHFTIEPRFGQPQALRLQLAARGVGEPRIRVNGHHGAWRRIEEAIGTPRIEIVAAPASRFEVTVTWTGAAAADLEAPAVAAHGAPWHITSADGAKILRVLDPQHALSELSVDGDRVEATPSGLPGHRTVFVQLLQDSQQWWEPVPVEVRAPIELLPSENQPRNRLGFRIRNNSTRPLRGDAEVILANGRHPLRLDVAPGGQSEELFLPADGLAPGSQTVAIHAADGRTIRGTIAHWQLEAPANAPFETVDLRASFNAGVTDIFQNEYLSPRSTGVSLALPKHGFGSWCRPHARFDVDDRGLRQAGGMLNVQGVPLATPSGVDVPNVVFTSQWDNYPTEQSVPLAGRASRVYLFLVGTTHATQSRFDNGEVVVMYTDGSQERLALHNPTTWWPIDQDYLIDDYAFRRPEPVPPRVDLATGNVRVSTLAEIKGRRYLPPGGGATVLDLPLDPTKDLQSLTVRTLANEIVIGLLSATLLR